ncbi:hypothetical protein, conserved [Eimeria necatrix]|uniref:Uncharacterized protein n=1 Tax=Eimeria necatrix TaxID=51315 RepID=U6N2F9_9EIME|nr:hypothetical protein, conserved [Eimeria necatrix]CDJ68949.1 hypothetical protein, conserved [Eimeria necatrix]
MPVVSPHRITVSDAVQYLQCCFRVSSLSSCAQQDLTFAYFWQVAVWQWNYVDTSLYLLLFTRRCATPLLLDGAISKQEQLTVGKLSNQKVFDEKQPETVEEGFAKRLRPLTDSHVVCLGLCSTHAIYRFRFSQAYTPHIYHYICCFSPEETTDRPAEALARRTSNWPPQRICAGVLRTLLPKCQLCAKRFR